MSSRRLAALLIGLLSLPLNFVGVDFTCADHGQPATAAAMPVHHGGGHDASTADAEPCEVPTQPDCCRAMMSCAVSVEIDTSAPSRGVPFARESIATGATRLPLSQTSPPDPPPPRA